MEVFTFLKYWRGGGGPPPPPPPAAPETTTDDDEGPFIDLEFTLPDESEDSPHRHSPHVHSSDSDDDDGHISFTLSPSTNNHPNPELHLDPSSFLNSNSNPNPPLPPPPFTASFLKSATKFRVFMLGLKKPKPNPTQQGKLCTVNFKVEEVPILSFFTRDNTSKPRASSNNKHESHSLSSPSSSTSSSEEKRLMHKYLRMVKPLYIRVSRSKYTDDKLNVNASPPLPPPTQNQGEDGASDEAEGSKLLGKSRSASAAVLVSSRRRDDSLLQQHDGIQSAILHCKRSFNASRECESSPLPRSVSNPLHDT